MNNNIDNMRIRGNLEGTYHLKRVKNNLYTDRIYAEKSNKCDKLIRQVKELDSENISKKTKKKFIKLVNEYRDSDFASMIFKSEFDEETIGYPAFTASLLLNGDHIDLVIVNYEHEEYGSIKRISNPEEILLTYEAMIADHNVKEYRKNHKR